MKENNEKIDEILKKFNEIEYATDEEIENMDFYELAFYTQCLNNLEGLYSEIESMKES